MQNVISGSSATSMKTVTEKQNVGGAKPFNFGPAFQSRDMVQLNADSGQEISAPTTDRMYFGRGLVTTVRLTGAALLLALATACGIAPPQDQGPRNVPVQVEDDDDRVQDGGRFGDDDDDRIRQGDDDDDREIGDDDGIRRGGDDDDERFEGDDD